MIKHFQIDFVVATARVEFIEKINLILNFEYLNTDAFVFKILLITEFRLFIIC